MGVNSRLNSGRLALLSQHGVELRSSPKQRGLRVQRAVVVRVAEQRAQRLEDGADRVRRRPLLLQDVEADPAKLVYVWVVDPRDEPDLTIIVMNVMIKR